MPDKEGDDDRSDRDRDPQVGAVWIVHGRRFFAAGLPNTGCVWEITGIILALAGAALGLWRSRSTRPGYYEAEVYTMTAISHRRFATASLAFAAAFALLGAFPVIPLFPVLAGYIVLAVLYLTSFARGAQGEDE